MTALLDDAWKHVATDCFILKVFSGTSLFQRVQATLRERGKQMDQAVEMESKRTGRVSENIEETWPRGVTK